MLLDSQARLDVLQWKEAPDVGEHMGRVQAHVAEFTPSEWEQVTEV
jgi:hypothetical protein